MSLSPGLCVRYKADAMRGVHHEDDRYMAALYTDKADLGPYTTQYEAAGEISGPGYKAGGVRLTGFEVHEEGTAAILTFDDLKIERATLKDVCGVLVYNATKANRAVGVVLLAEKTSSTNGPFEVFFPLPTAAEGLFVVD